MSRKALIVLGIAITVVVVVSLMLQPHFWKLILKKPVLEIEWSLNNNTKAIGIQVINDGYGTVDITRVELVYLPDETLGLIWIELRTIEPQHGWGFSTILEDGEQLDFFNLLLEGKDKEIIKIIVETPKAIYTFVPHRWIELTKPTSIEKK